MSRLSLINPFSPLNIHNRICYNNDGGGGGDDNGGVNDDMSFNEAFSTARGNKGAGQTFTHKGKSYSTAVAGEDRALDNAMAKTSTPTNAGSVDTASATTQKANAGGRGLGRADGPDSMKPASGNGGTDYWAKLIEAGESDVSALDALAMPAVNNSMYNFNVGMNKNAVQDYFTTGAGSMGYTALDPNQNETASGRSYAAVARNDYTDLVGGTDYYGSPTDLPDGRPAGTVMQSGPNQKKVYNATWNDNESILNSDGQNIAQFGTLYRNSVPDADGVETTITEPVSLGPNYSQAREAFPEISEEETLALSQTNPVAGFSPLIPTQTPASENPIDSSAFMNAMKKVNAQTLGETEGMLKSGFQTGADKELVENYGWTRNSDGTASPPTSAVAAPATSGGGTAAPAKEMSLGERIMATLRKGSDPIPNPEPSDGDDDPRPALPMGYNVGAIGPTAPVTPTVTDPNADPAVVDPDQPDGSTVVDPAVADDIFADADQDGYITELEADVANLRQQLALLTNTSTAATQGMSRDQVLAMIQEAMNNNNSSGYNSQTFQNAFGFAPQANYFGQVVPSNVSEDGVYERRAVRDKDTGEIRYVNVPIGNASLTGTSGYQRRRREGFGRSIDIF